MKPEPEANNPKRQSGFFPAHGYVPALESAEFLIVKWEAKADELEHMASEYRKTLTGLVAMTLEKARAYRSCIKELRRHTEANNVRQPD